MNRMRQHKELNRQRRLAACPLVHQHKGLNRQLRLAAISPMAVPEA